MTARLRETYNNEVFGALKEKFQYKNVMEVPKLSEDHNQYGSWRSQRQRKGHRIRSRRDRANQRTETGYNQGKKSIANFKVRQGMPVGAKVTLRGDNMYEFC